MRVTKIICNKGITFVLLYDIVFTELELKDGFGSPWVGALKKELVLLGLVP